jgi:hypothetical protein
MKLWVGVTDNDWYRFLRSRPELDEVKPMKIGVRQTLLLFCAARV